MKGIVIKKDHVDYEGLRIDFKNYYPTPECMECGGGTSSGFGNNCANSCQTYKEWKEMQQ